jgi:hypothetical protein
VGLRFKGKARSNIKLLKKERVPEERSLGEGPDQVAVQENVEGRRMEQMRRLRKITGGIGRSFQPLSDGYLDSLELFCMRSRHSLELRGLMFPGEMSMDTFISNWVLDRAHIFRSGHSFLESFGEDRDRTILAAASPAEDERWCHQSSVARIAGVY